MIASAMLLEDGATPHSALCPVGALSAALSQLDQIDLIILPMLRRLPETQ
jgi:hypothetical protein